VEESLLSARSSESRAPTLRVLAFTAAFLPGYKAGGPIKSMVAILDNLPDDVRVKLVTADRDLGDSAPYPGLSGRLVARGRHHVYYLNWRDPRHWTKLLAWARRNPIDLLYVNSLWSPQFTVLPLVAHRLRLFAARQVLIAPRGELADGALRIKWRKKRAFLHVWAPMLRGIDPLWNASSELEEREVRRRFPWARTIVSGDSAGDAPRGEIVASSHRARFVFIGRVMQSKNVKLALSALQLVHSELEFDIYGPLQDNAYWDSCQRLIERLPQNVHVNYRGALLPEKVQETFAGYDGFIFPTFGENFGHVIPESLSAGCPVMCSMQTPWTAVLQAGGGVALSDMRAASWAAEIDRRAMLTPTQRTRAKRLALAAYADWRGGTHHASGVELALNEL
jgi:glycosyltransferase involved in cell wall biosynthesis